MAVSIIQFPTGSFGYVGSVPVNMAHKISGGTCFQRKAIADAVVTSGPGLARKIAERQGVSFSTRSFDSRAEALSFAEEFCRVNGLDDVVIHG